MLLLCLPMAAPVTVAGRCAEVLFAVLFSKLIPTAESPEGRFSRGKEDGELVFCFGLVLEVSLKTVRKLFFFFSSQIGKQWAEAEMALKPEAFPP